MVDIRGRERSSNIDDRRKRYDRTKMPDFSDRINRALEKAVTGKEEIAPLDVLLATLAGRSPGDPSKLAATATGREKPNLDIARMQSLIEGGQLNQIIRQMPAGSLEVRKTPSSAPYQTTTGNVIWGSGGNNTLRGGAGEDNGDIPPEALAFLDAISGPESRGHYTIRFGGKHFSDMSDHPRVGRKITSGPNKGKLSTAAGRYQITQTTWDNVIQPALNLPDFSPESQDKAAWWLAQRDYRRKGGGDLLGDLRTGDPAVIGSIAKKLSGTWTSLPGGIEQATTTNKFVTAYNQAYQERNVSPVVPPPPNRGGTALAAINDAISAPSVPPIAAYAPSSGSLTASPLPTAPALPPAFPRAPAALPRPMNAPPIPSGRATDIPPTRAVDIPPISATPPRPSLPAIEPLAPTIRATDLNPDTIAPTGPMGRGRPRAPEPPPRITEQMLTEWAAKNFTPAPRGTDLTTRKVTSIPVTPSSPLAGNVPDLQTALNAEADRRREMLPGLPAMPPTPPVRASDMTFMEKNKGIPTSAYPTLQPLPSPTLRPLETEGIQVAEDLTPRNLPPGFTPNLPFGAPADVTRLTPNVPLDPPAPPPVPGSILTGALNAPLGAMTQPGAPSFKKGAQVAGAPPIPMPRKYGRVPPEEMVNPTFIPPADPLTRQVIKMANSPGANFLGEVNSGKRPFANFLMSLFTPRQGQIATSRSVLPSGYRPASAENGLSGAQIDIARQQSRGDDSYERLIKWAMSS